MESDQSLPGQTPLDDRSGLKLKHIRNIAQLNEAEFRNVALAVAKYLAGRLTRRMAPFTVAWMLKLHGQMFGQVWSWAGQPRRTDGLNIGVKAYRIASDLQQLADDIAFWRDNQGPQLVEQAAIIHHRATQIHPFLNGNGRWARLLADIHLRLNGHPLTRWPREGIVAHTSPIRDEYIAALKEADAGDIAPLTELHRRYCVAD